jgi:hypothetical protein
VTKTEEVAHGGNGNRGSNGGNIEAAEPAAEKYAAMTEVAAEGTGAMAAAASTVAMTPADNSGNGGGR